MKLFTVADGVQDREAFRTILARLGIDSHAATDETGHPTIALDRDGMKQLGARFAARGDSAQAAAIQRALDA